MAKEKKPKAPPKPKPLPSDLEFAKMLAPLLAGVAVPAHAGTARKPSLGVFVNGKVGEQLRQKMSDEGYVESYPRTEVDDSGAKAKIVTVQVLKLTDSGRAFVLRYLGSRDLLESLPTSLDATRQGVKIQVGLLEGRIETLTKTISESTGKLSEVFAQFGAAMQKSMETTLESLKTKVAPLEAKIVGLKVQLAEIKTAHAELMSNADNADTRMRETIELAAKMPVSVSIKSNDTGAGPKIDEPLLDFVRDCQTSQRVNCPFDKLYDHLKAAFSELQIGYFHDTLRRLSRAGTLTLSAWMGIVADIPNPDYVLTVNNQSMYYAQTGI